ncbi:protein of unknown function [Austwickia chelonae]|uniref:DUF4282 domain-containing protein n=1 Tax=Austwickia chelonae TaxID=100225 RepID=UPI0008B7AB9C|nr:DUF4282 domain-containing protein [Austwickia chelonae]SEW34293.1 protein of unknown function [Austwickia chelonae]
MNKDTIGEGSRTDGAAPQTTPATKSIPEVTGAAAPGSGASPAVPAAGSSSAPVHPAWSQQPQASYDQVYSGGWGTPGHSDSGPIRLTGQGGSAPAPGSSSPAASSADLSTPQWSSAPSSSAPATMQVPSPGVPYGQGAPAPSSAPGAPMAPGGFGVASPGGSPGYGAAPAESSWSTPSPYGQPYGGAPAAPASESAQFSPYGAPSAGGPGAPSYGSAASAPQSDPQASRSWSGQQQPQSRSDRPSDPRSLGLAAMLDFTFVARATRALAPILFWLVVAWSLFSVITGLASSFTAPGYARNDAAVFFGFLTSVVRSLIAIAMTRIFLELCVNVADLADKRAEDGKSS